MNIELKELFKVEDCSLGVEEIAKRMKIKKLTKENIRKLKGDLSLLEKAGKIYYNIVNDEYEILPAFFHTVRVNKVEDSIISFSINKNKCYLESKNKHIHKNSIIIVKQDGSKFKLVKIVEFPKDKKLNYSEKKIINALKPIYPSYTLKALKKITKNEDIKDELDKLVNEGVIYYDDDDFKYKKMPSNYYLTTAEVNKKGCYLANFHGEKITLPDDLAKDLLPFDKIIIEKSDEGIKLKKIVKRTNPKIVLEVTQDNKIRVVGNDIIVKCESEEFKNLHLVPGTRFLGNISCKKTFGSFDIEFLEVLNYKNDLDSELEAIGINNGFIVRYTDEELEQVKNTPMEVTESDLKNRLDLTNETIFTIDGIHTKDMDDAVGLKILPNGNFMLTVAIADVSHYIPYGSPLWKRAAFNTTSLYLVDSVSHMLHPQISNGICSLNPNQIRLCKAYLIEIDKNGNIVDFNYENAFIKSKMKMNYDDVNKILEDNTIPDGYEEYVSDLLLMQELSKIITSRRKENGNIDFDSKEIVFEFDEEKNLSGISTRSQNAAEKLIENFMIITNQGMAEYMLNLNIDFIFRNHELPIDSKVRNTVNLIKSMGYHIDALTRSDDPRVIQKIISTISTKEEFFILSSLLLRSMQKAYFSTENKGHYGLALKAYSQTTSPIRRLMDLVIEYIIDNLELMYSDNDFTKSLKSLCERASYMERCADKAEYEADKLYMVDYCIKNKDLVYEGFIQTITSKYVVVRTKELIEGIVYLDDLDNGDYTYIKDNKWLQKNNNHLIIGSKLELTFKDADREHRIISFYGKTNELILKRKK